MKKVFDSKRLLKVLLFSGIMVYVACIFVNQQKSLNAYKGEQQYVAEKIKEQTEYKETLASMKQNVNSSEYIESVAREKLDMYMPNERVYIDITK